MTIEVVEFPKEPEDPWVWVCEACLDEYEEKTGKGFQVPSIGGPTSEPCNVCGHQYNRQQLSHLKSSNALLVKQALHRREPEAKAIFPDSMGDSIALRDNPRPIRTCPAPFLKGEEMKARFLIMVLLLHGRAFAEDQPKLDYQWMPAQVAQVMHDTGAKTPAQMRKAADAYAKEFERHIQAAEAQEAKVEKCLRRYRIVDDRTGETIGVVKDLVDETPKDFLRRVIGCFNFFYGREDVYSTDGYGKPALVEVDK